MYQSPACSPKELSVLPRLSVTIAATTLRYGQLSQDELLVTETGARAGVKHQRGHNLYHFVTFKHFGPDNEERGL